MRPFVRVASKNCSQPKLDIRRSAIWTTGIHRKWHIGTAYNLRVALTSEGRANYQLLPGAYHFETLGPASLLIHAKVCLAGMRNRIGMWSVKSCVNRS